MARLPATALADRVLGWLACLPLCAQASGADIDLASLPAGGLAVVSGADAPRHAQRIGGSGRWLVRVAVPASAAGQAADATSSLHPLVTVSAGEDRLPFADDSVNAVVIGAGSALAMAEARRVLAPGGALLVERDGSFAASIEPEDRRFAPWTHWQADEFASGASADAAVAPSNRLRWWNQRVIGAQLRTAGGVVAVVEDAIGGESRSYQLDTQGLQGVDAFSGVTLWYRARAVPPRSYDIRQGFVGHPLGFIHPQHERGQPAVLTSRASGEVLATYDQGLRSSSGAAQRSAPSFPLMMVHGDILYQALGGDLVALDVPTGKMRWRAAPAGAVAKLIVSRDGQRLYTVECPVDEVRPYLRWGSMPATSIAAYRAEDGSQLWRNAEFAAMESTRAGRKASYGSVFISEIVEFRDTLFAWDQVSNIGGDLHGDLFALDPSTGSVRWHHADTNGKQPGQKEYEKHGEMLNNPVIWNGGLWTKGRSFALDRPAQAKAPFVMMTGNDRCVRYSGSAEYLMLGFNSYIGRDFTSYQTGLTRGNCSIPNAATYGAVISATDETCSCYNGPRGQVALIPDAPVEPIADALRLDRPAAAPAAAPVQLPPSPIVDDWRIYPSMNLDAPQIPEVAANGFTLVSDGQRHMITAYRGDPAAGDVAWRYRGDGRGYARPLVHGDRLYVPSAAGTITCLDLASGAPRWRFLAAPNRDAVVVNGQLESRWPVRGIVAADGRIHAAAGRHAELDGGLWLWSLDAASGAIAHRCRIHLPISVVRSGEQPRWTAARSLREIASRGILLGGMAVDGEGRVCVVNRLWLKFGSRAAANGYWKPLGERAKQAGTPGGPTLPAYAPGVLQAIAEQNGNDFMLVNMPDFSAPSQELLPIDMAAWDGKLLDPITAFDLAKGPGIRKAVPWTSPFAASTGGASAPGAAPGR